MLSEYDGNNNLLRKYIYGPGIDQPVCMIEVAESNAAYYYHFDGLGSVVALSDSSGDTVQTYQYSVFGQVAVEDVDHPNPYMFAGVRFDMEIGLYYNRARYYNPYTGRFLRADPISYGDGMNMYAYCGNNSLNCTDPMGLIRTVSDVNELTAVIFSVPDNTRWGLVGEWEVNDLCAWYSCDAKEIKGPFRINGINYYIELDLGINTGKKYERDNNGEVVKLDSTLKPQSSSIFNSLISVKEVNPPPFGTKGWTAGILGVCGLGVFIWGGATGNAPAMIGGGLVWIGTWVYAIVDLCRDKEPYVQVVLIQQQSREGLIERIGDGEGPIKCPVDGCPNYLPCHRHNIDHIE